MGPTHLTTNLGSRANWGARSPWVCPTYFCTSSPSPPPTTTTTTSLSLVFSRRSLLNESHPPVLEGLINYGESIPHEPTSIVGPEPTATLPPLIACLQVNAGESRSENHDHHHPSPNPMGSSNRPSFAVHAVLSALGVLPPLTNPDVAEVPASACLTRDLLDPSCRKENRWACLTRPCGQRLPRNPVLVLSLPAMQGVRWVEALDAERS